MQLPDACLHQIFLSARTHNGFSPEPVSDAALHAIYDLAKWGPTSANASPARFVFVRSAEAKALLRPALAEGNRDKTMAAPVTVIVAYDTEFYEQMPRLFPQVDFRSGYLGKPALIETVGFRNGTLQGAYFIIAARALGYDCGPMSGFDNAQLDAAFFPDGKWKSNFLCNLGHGDPSKVRPRNPRLSFEEACRVV